MPLKVAHRMREVRKQLELPDPSAFAGTLGPRAPDEQEVLTSAALDVLTYIAEETEKLTPEEVKPASEMTIAELALDNTMLASQTVNAVLRKYKDAPDTGDPAFDLKRDTMAGHLANSTIRTLARVHEAWLRGQNTDRLALILDQIRELDDEDIDQ